MLKNSSGESTLLSILILNPMKLAVILIITQVITNYSQSRTRIPWLVIVSDPMKYNLLICSRWFWVQYRCSPEMYLSVINIHNHSIHYYRTSADLPWLNNKMDRSGIVPELYANIGIVPERYLLLIAQRIYLYQTDYTIQYTDTELAQFSNNWLAQISSSFTKSLYA